MCGPAPEYEYQVLATNLGEEILSVADLYRQRADAENVYDELKNQWGSRRLHDQGFIALPDHRAARSAGLQLVEFVRALRPARATARSRDEPTVAAVRGGPGGGERAATHAAPDQHPRRSGARPAPADGPEPVPERTAKRCGAVEPGGVLGADLDEDFGAVAAATGDPAGSERLKPTSSASSEIQTSACPVESPDRFSGASLTRRFKE